MTLGFLSQGGSRDDLIPLMKWDAKGGDLSLVDRVQTASGEWEKEVRDVALPIKLAMDITNMQIGWVKFPENAPPEFKMVTLGDEPPAQPDNDFQKSFKVRVGSKDTGLREFSSTSSTVRKAMDSILNQFIAQAGTNNHKIPVVEIKGSMPVNIKTRKGDLRFKAPDWNIVSWIDKPEMFNQQAEVTESAPEPVAAQPAPAVSDDDLF